MIDVGFSLQPDRDFLEACMPLFEEDADYFEIAPETTWRPTRDDRWAPNDYHACFLALGERLRRPFVAHGVGYSLAGCSPRDAPRRRRWLERIARDHAAFRFRWYSDHLGASTLEGLNLTLPIAAPMTDAAARQVRARLGALAAIVPLTGVENSAAYFLAGRALDEPAFLNACARQAWIVLDLHNLHLMALNLGFDPEAYLARLDLCRVIEIHLAGGTPSEAAWLPSGRSLRLDGHDAAVPEEVWRLYARVARACPQLRGVTLERMEGTVTRADVPGLREEMRRARLAS